MQDKNTDASSFFPRVEYLKISKGWTWDEVAKKLQLTRVMLHYIKKEKYAVSKKHMFRLEELERQEGVSIPGARDLIEGIILSGEEARVKITQVDFDRGYVDALVKYTRGEPVNEYPKKIRLVRPDTKTAAKLIVALRIDEDFEKVLFACIEDKKFATREFINLLTPFSFQALMDAAERLTFGAHWKPPQRK